MKTRGELQRRREDEGPFKMSVRTMFLLIFFVFMGLLGSLVYVSYLSAQNQKELTASETRRFESYKLADQLRQSSDDLTRLARTYVVTGDPVYEQYFFDVLAIRNGEKPRPENYERIYWDFVVATRKKPTPDGKPVSLQNLMQEMNFTAEEFAKLDESKARSDALVRLEEKAMNAVKGKFDDGSGNFTIAKEPDLEMARQIMHGEEYHRAKSAIMEPIGDFLTMLDVRTAREVQSLRQKGHIYAGVMLSLAGAGLAFTLGAFFVLRWRVIVPVRKLVVAAEQVGAGQYDQRVEHASSDELGGLALAFNHMTSSIQRDISERKQAQAELKKLSRAVDQSPSSVVITDVEGRIEYVNPKFTQVTGYTWEEVIGENPRVLKSDNQPPEFYEDLWKTITSGREWHGDFCNRKKTGELYWESASISPVRSASGEITHFVAVKEDVTQRKEVELATQEARRAAEEAKTAADAANRAKSDFLANMSHEIRTPMNGIIGMTDLTLDTDLTPEQRDYLNTVKSSADSLLSLINDILDFSKIEAGKLELEPIDFALRDALADMLNTLANRAHTKGIELVYEVAPDVHDVLTGDVYRLRQVIVNLVGNAIKFTERGEIAVSVTEVERTDRDLTLHFSVRDTGIGIPPDKLDAVFKPFSQADVSTTRRYGGTGLGLAICGQLVELMSGRMWAESEPRQGSTFHFTAEFGIGQASPTLEVDTNRELLDGLPVLVVDDNATNRRILDQMLRNWHMAPASVTGGAEALAALDRAANAGSPFRLVLSDVNMPEMDGFMLFESARSDLQHRDVPFVLLTSAARPGDAARCREIGVAAHLIKPVKQSLLLNAILNAVAGKDVLAKSRTTMETISTTKADRNLRVLLAEDNEVNQKFAVRVIEKAGHAIVVANNGQEAVDAWERDRFDVILMDVQMPELDGFGATTRIRELEQERGTPERTPIIAMTANAMKGDRERCLQVGMDGYVSKPVKRQTLFAEIDSVLGVQ